MQQPLFEVHWTERALERMRQLYDWVTEHDCEENAASLVERLFEAGDGLVWSPLRYESAPEWGDGVRCPSLGGVCCSRWMKSSGASTCSLSWAAPRIRAIFAK